MSMSKETRYIFGGIFIAVVVLLLFTCGSAVASPGDDGCVGNCDDGTNTPAPITNTATNNNAILNANKNTNDIRTTNTNANLNNNDNTNKNTNKNTNTNTNTNLNANISTNKNTNTISNTSRSVSNATGGVGYGGSSTSSANAVGGNSSATASNGSQTTAVTVDNRNPSSLRTVGIAPDVSAYSTAPCRIAVGASGGWMGGAFGFSGSVLDEGCDIWRDHLNLRLAGYAYEADLRLCDKPELKKLFGEKCGSQVIETSYSSSFKIH